MTSNTPVESLIRVARRRHSNGPTNPSFVQQRLLTPASSRPCDRPPASEQVFELKRNKNKTWRGRHSTGDTRTGLGKPPRIPRQHFDRQTATKPAPLRHSHRLGALSSPPPLEPHGRFIRRLPRNTTQQEAYHVLPVRDSRRVKPEPNFPTAVEPREPPPPPRPREFRTTRRRAHQQSFCCRRPVGYNAHRKKPAARKKRGSRYSFD